jgi:dipeptide/tripeptide permease
MFRAFYFSLNVGVLFGVIFMPSLSQLAGGYKLAFFLLLGVAILCIFLLLLSSPTRLSGHGVARAVCCCSCDRDSKHDLWRIVKFFLPLPVFWLLFYNMLSLWVSSPSNKSIVFCTAFES